MEDAEEDTLLLERVLRRGGFSPCLRRVDTSEDMRAALSSGPWELVIADYNMPNLSGVEALAIFKASGLEVPFIVVSGAIGEDVAVETMRAGAHDYVLKHNLTRLPAAIDRELREAAVRRERRRSERAQHFLAKAGDVPARSLDWETTLAEVANLAVPEIADWCGLDVREDDDTIRRLTVGRRPGAETAVSVASARLAREGVPPVEREVMEKQAPLYLSPLGDTVLSSFAIDGEEQARLAAMARGTYLAVPLVARGEVMGALVLASGEPASLEPLDLALGEELARRCAMALDNARLYREAQRAVQARDDFLGIAAHELRTPLTPLLLRLQILRRHVEAEMPGSPLASMLEGAIRNFERLARLVDNLLDISRISAGRLSLDLEESDLGEIARDVLERFLPETERAGCRIDLSCQGRVVGHWDRLRLERVVSNLVSNAIRYGQGKPVHIMVGLRGDRGVLSVTDEGPGIEAADRERIFKRFERGSATRERSGLGLGLSIVKQIVEAHGGRIVVDSPPGAGATFTVELPLSGVTATSPSREAPAARA